LLCFASHSGKKPTMSGRQGDPGNSEEPPASSEFWWARTIAWIKLQNYMSKK